MTDINGTVVGIQGTPVDSESPTDGYVLTYDGDDGYWAPRPVPQAATGLNKQYFTSSGTWVCPVGITSILIIAAGGGAGGQAGRGGGSPGNGGNNAIQVMTLLNVTPGVTYTITIGAGGLGGTGDQVTQPNNWTSPTTLVNYVSPTSGNLTSFSQSGTILFSVKGANWIGSSPDVFINTFNNGNNGSTVTGYFSGAGGLGGYAGPQGNGGNGGNGAKSTGGTPVTAYNGSNAGANTGAGGGGGGGCGHDGTPYTCMGGNGGNGGSGYMYIVY